MKNVSNLNIKFKMRIYDNELRYVMITKNITHDLLTKKQVKKSVNSWPLRASVFYTESVKILPFFLCDPFGFP